MIVQSIFSILFSQEDHKMSDNRCSLLSCRFSELTVLCTASWRGQAGSSFRGIVMHQFVDLTEVLTCLERSANSSRLGGPDQLQPEKDVLFRWKQVKHSMGL